MASSDYREDLFAAYPARLADLDPDRGTKIAWFEDYVARNYASHLKRFDRSKAALLDVGCSRGYLLAALAELGFTRLAGIDVSSEDIAVAQQWLPEAALSTADARNFLAKHPDSFDIVILKAVLEHTPKGDVLPLLRDVWASLRDDGIAIVDVPNMDWLFAGHERYMDFTHEVGFTRESLRQVMTTAFSTVEIVPVDHLTAIDRSSWRTRVARRIVGRLLCWADPQGAQNPIWSRNLVAVGSRRGLAKAE